MHHAITLLVVAILATIALAAPTPAKPHVKRSFAVSAKGHARKLSPAEAMKQAAQKYGFEVNTSNEHDRRHLFDFEFGSSAAWPFPSALPSGFPWFEFSSSVAPYPRQQSSAYYSSSSASYSYAPSSSFAPSSAAPTVVPTGHPQPSTTSSSGPAPTSSSPSSGGNEEGEVSAVPGPNEVYYLSPVTIGNQQFHLNFDTGSSDLWVFDKSFASSGVATFDPSKSSTWSDYQGASWEIQYGDGSSAGGSVGFDKVSIGDAVVQKQCVEIADHASNTFFQDPDQDGLVGLGFGAAGNQVLPQPQKTFFESIMPDLEQPVFTADLEENASGTYEFGSIDSSKYSGDIHYTPVDSSMGYWEFESKSYSIGGTQAACPSCNNGIADTGTSLILVDQAVADAYYKQVEGAQYSSTNMGYMYPCSSSLPDFGVAIGGYTATVKGADMTYAQDGSSCFGGVQGTGTTNVPVQIFGDVLLKHFFAVFDGGNKRFGIADKAS